MKRAYGCLLAKVFLLATVGVASAAPEITARLTASPLSHTDKCPAVIKFTGMISVTAPTTVQYKFIRSDGASAPVQTLVFDKPGKKPVTTTWTLGGPELPTYEGWEAIKIISPRQVASNKASFSITCAGQQPGNKPDLVIEGIRLDRDCNVMVKVRNVGKGKIPDEVWTVHSPESSAVYLTINKKGWGGDAIWRFDPGKNLQDPGGTVVYRSTLKVSGSAVVNAQIDHTHQVAESNETNNSKTVKLGCPK
jgi:hypothetical protein